LKELRRAAKPPSAPFASWRGQKRKPCVGMILLIAIDAIIDAKRFTRREQ
jgi:hypothetical protein